MSWLVQQKGNWDFMAAPAVWLYIISKSSENVKRVGSFVVGHLAKAARDKCNIIGSLGLKEIRANGRSG